MIQKIRPLFQRDQTIFLLSNIIFSASTYAVMLLLPYLLSIESMAEFSSAYNAMIILLFIFEFGISVSFLRFYQIYRITFFINLLAQSAVLIFLIALMLTPLGKGIIGLFHIDTSPEGVFLFFAALIAQTLWTFAKNILLSNRNYHAIFYHSLIILTLRILLLGYLYYVGDVSLITILITMFILPFLITFIIPILSAHRIITEFKPYFRHKRMQKILLFYLKRFVQYSFLSYLIGVLYIIAGRYLIVYLTEKHETALVADLGYAMTFLGIIMIASASFRTFFIATYHLGDMQSITYHLERYLGNIRSLSLYILLISFLLSITVYLIMPGYLSYRAPLFVFIMTSTYGIIFLFSMITFLARTMSYNRLEITINLIRLLIIILITHLFFRASPLFSFFLINASLLGMEVVFAYLILKKVRYAQ